MPVEVKAHRYLFAYYHWSEPRSPGPLIALGLCPGLKPDTPAKAEERRLAHEAWKSLFDKPLRYNPLHDLESLWWIGSYFLLTRGVVAEGPMDEEQQQAGKAQLQKQRTAFRRLFHSCS